MFQGRMIRRSFLVIAASGFLFSGVGASEDPPVTPSIALSDVVQKVIDKHPTLEERRSFLAVAHAKAREQRWYLYPTVDINVSGGREWSRNASTKSSDGDGFLPLTRLENSLVLSQLLFDGRQSSNRLDAALNREESAQHQLMGTAEEIGLRAVEVYINFLRYNALLEVAKENLKRHTTIMADIEERTKAGLDTAADLHQAETRTILAKTRLAVQEGELAKAVSSYRETVGEAPGAMDIPKLGSEHIPEQPEQAILTSEEKSPVVQSFITETNARKNELEAATGVFLPQLSLDLKGSRNQNIDGVRGHNDDIVAMLQLRYNLFRGGADVARKRQAVHEYQRSLSSLAESKRKLRESIRLSYDVIKTAEAQLGTEKKHVEESLKLIDIYKEQLQIGTRTLLALLYAEDERFVAAANAKNQEYLLLFAQYELLAKMGKLMDTLKVKVSPEM